ncbi:phage major capsid protein [Christensenellaceae bacterium NSJ-53]|uniref:Phage major capsid protein n=2 Tax=Gehongia tenuis TaxID=2763655 RepID=A0A926D6I4_9FIRM|nr:phage major capsid protein [Gehongia tenuis]
MTLYQIKEAMAQVGAELNAQRDWISAHAADPETSIETIRAAKAKRDELGERFAELKEEHDRMEAETKQQMEAQPKPDEKTKKIEARAKFYRAALAQQVVPREVMALLGAVPAGDSTIGNGDNLLPVNVSNEIITEPMEINPMRQIEQVTNITNLEKPKLDFTLDDDDFVTDSETAKELAMDGDMVRFGRHKSKVKAQVSDTVYRGTTTNLVSTIENALRSGLAAKEKKVQFDANPASELAHMSFYSNSTGIRKVYGTTMLAAIMAAYADLPDMFAENARVVMRRIDYVNMISDLANGSAALWGKKPEDIIGIPVVFVDRAVKPIVGDFRYAQLNYDINTSYDTDKDVDKGLYKFVLTAWFDHQILLKSAFRIAEVGQDPNPADDEPTVVDVKTVAALPATDIKEGTVYVLTATDGDRAAGTMWIYANSDWIQYGA